MQSPASVEIDGETFAYKTEPRCLVCSSSSRLEVESALAKGLTYERIAETFGERDGINARGERAHVSRGHIPIVASPNAMRLAEHSAGIHIETELDCLGCEKDARAAEV